MKRFFAYTIIAAIGLSLTACKTESHKDKSDDLAQLNTTKKATQPEDLEAPEGYEIFKSTPMVNDWKLTMIHPEKVSIKDISNQIMLKYYGENNKSMRGMSDGYIMSITLVKDEALANRVTQNASQDFTINEKAVLKYSTTRSDRKGNATHYAFILEEGNDEQEALVVDVTTVLNGDNDEAYTNMILETLETLKWSKTTNK